jgi:hypothetical protein
MHPTSTNTKTRTLIATIEPTHCNLIHLLLLLVPAATRQLTL